MSTGCLRRSLLIGIIAMGLFASTTLSAQTLVSASYRLRGGTFAAIEGTPAASTAASPEIGSLRGIGAQTSVVGRSTGASSGRVLEGGFLPAVRFVPEPTLPIALLTAVVSLVGFGRRRAS